MIASLEIIKYDPSPKEGSEPPEGNDTHSVSNRDSVRSFLSTGFVDGSVITDLFQGNDTERKRGAFAELLSCEFVELTKPEPATDATTSKLELATLEIDYQE
ncbi:hypothetical protein P8786_23410, partial [Bacillus subtilis]|uniref:hypothetical protein n=1 Tax=Bacillus subtilis TaxID=1423 RepID=UPI002DBF6A23